MLPVSWRAGRGWSSHNHTSTAVGIWGNFEQLVYVSNNLPPSLVSSLCWTEWLRLTYVKVSQVEKHLGQNPQSLTSPSFCNLPPLSLHQQIVQQTAHDAVVLQSMTRGAGSLRSEKWLNTKLLAGWREPCPVTKSYMCLDQMGSLAFQCSLPSCVILRQKQSDDVLRLFQRCWLWLLCSINRSACRNLGTDKRLTHCYSGEISMQILNNNEKVKIVFS